MKKFKYTLKNPAGLHARTAGMIVRLALGYNSKITIEANGNTGDAQKIFSLMELDALYGSEVVVICDGNDENEAVAEFKKLFEENIF